MKDRNYKLLDIFAGLFTASLIISNILAFRLFQVGNIVLDSGILIFPIVYIINDILSEIYGFKIASRIILLGFLTNLIAVIFFNIAMILPSPGFFNGAEAFKTVIGSSFRILVASFSAYLVGTLANSYVLVWLKNHYGKSMFVRYVSSTIVGETLDSIIFINIAFLFTMPLDAMLIMIISQIVLKTLYEIVMFPITKYVTLKLKEIEDN